MPAPGAFLRTELRRDLDDELSGSPGFVGQEHHEQTPAGRQDRPVESGLGAGSVLGIPSRILLFGFRPLRHVFDFEILDDEKGPVGIGDEVMGGLVDHIFADVLRIFEGPGEPGFALLPVVRAFDLSGEFSLPAFFGPFFLLHPDLLDGGEIDPSPIACHHRNRHAPVEAQGFALKLLFRKHPEPGDRVLFLRLRESVVRGEGDEPLPGLDRDVKRGGTGIRGMGLEGQNPHRELLCSENQFFELRFVVGPKAEEFRGDPDRLPSVFSLEDGFSGESGKESSHRLFPSNRSVTEYLGGNLPEPGGLRADETGILLIDGNGRSRKRDRFFGEGPVIPVLGDLGVVDEPLVPDPLEQDLFLGGSGIRAKALACLHGSMIPLLTWKLNQTSPVPMPSILLSCTLSL